MYTCLRAKVYVYNWYVSDISYSLGGGALKVNLFHGIPLKRIQGDTLDQNSIEHQLWKGAGIRARLLRLLYWDRIVKPDMLLATSDEVAEIYSRAFKISKSSTFLANMPREDGLCRELASVITE